MGKRLRVVCHSWDGTTLLAGNGYYILDKELDYSGEQNNATSTPQGLPEEAATATDPDKLA